MKELRIKDGSCLGLKVITDGYSQPSGDNGIQCLRKINHPSKWCLGINSGLEGKSYIIN